jgi:DNA processing protein
MALRGITVVSGLALGIDGASHCGALEVGGDTVAVLGSGVDCDPAGLPSSPRQTHRPRGASPFGIPSGRTAWPHHFPRRNKIHAEWNGAVVVVEAAEKNGALITVEHALDLGRDVYAVPGARDAPQSRGCNTLIHQGTQVITSPEEFGRDLGLVCGSSSEFQGCAVSQGVRSQVPAGLDDEARHAWPALSEQSLGIDVVVFGADLQSARVLSALTILQVSGLVVQESGMRFRRAS